MSKELMSLDIIEHYRSYFASRAEARMVELCDVAKAAHEWKEKYEVADASLANNEIVIGELRKEIEKLKNPSELKYAPVHTLLGSIADLREENEKLREQNARIGSDSLHLRLALQTLEGEVEELNKKIENLRIRKRHYVMWNLQHRAELEDKLRTARADERERCADLINTMRHKGVKRDDDSVGAPRCYECEDAIRALKDSE